MNRSITSLLICVIAVCIMIGCSSHGTPSAPVLNDGIDRIGDSGNRTSLGFYGFTFDEATLEIHPIEQRHLEAHYMVSAFLAPPNCSGDGCLSYGVNSWDPITRALDLNVTIENPTALTGYDTRLVFLDFIDREVLNPDSYTSNFDPDGDINPFIAFAKSDPNRTFNPGPAEYTESVVLYWPIEAGGNVVTLVEASWPDNCPEPYEINNIITSGHMITTGPIDISCDVYDWQDDIDWVRVDTTPLTGGWTVLTNISGNTWSGTASNTEGAFFGDYTCWIQAHSSTDGTYTNVWNKVTLKVSMHRIVRIGIYDLPASSCTPDIGVVGAYGSDMDSHIFVAGDDPLNDGDCDAIDIYTEYYSGVSLFKSLVNLDPWNDSYQPWPVNRIDVTHDGSFGWSNLNTESYEQSGYTPEGGVANSEIYSNIDRYKWFDPRWPDDHRHFDPSITSPGWFPIDVCDGFNRYQYSLMIDYSSDARLIGLPGWPSDDYTNNDVVFYTSFAQAGLIGPGPGKIEPGDNIAGIDAFMIDDNTLRLFVVENSESEWAVEVFHITNDAVGWDFDSITSQFSIPFPTARPADCETLPINPDFTPCPDAPVLFVPVQFSTGGGCMIIYDALTGSYVGSLGALGWGLTSPPLQTAPMYVDTDDGKWEIHVVVEGPSAHVFKWV